MTIALDRPIRMAIAEPHYTTQIVPDHYELTPHGRLAWLHRLLWRALHKMRALKLGVEEVATYKTVTIDCEHIAERVMEAQYRLRGRGYRASRILIGPEEMAELTREDAHRQLSMRVDSLSLTYRGLSIEVVPHMRGVLVL
jgi:hypothetical protein